MAEFTPIESQEQLDAILKERLSRAQAKHQKEMEELTAKYSGHDEMATELETFKNKVSDLEKSIKEKDEKLTAYERASVKNRIAEEFNLDPKLASRLTGETEEELRKDAEALVAIVGKGSRNIPGKSPEVKDPEDGVTAEFRKLNPHIEL